MDVGTARMLRVSAQPASSPGGGRARKRAGEPNEVMTLAEKPGINGNTPGKVMRMLKAGKLARETEIQKATGVAAGAAQN